MKYIQIIYLVYETGGAMRKIAICEEAEYNRRLSIYLSRSMPADVMIYTFSSAEFLQKQKEDMDLYVMGETFYQEVEETWKQGERMGKDRIIFILDSTMEGAYCRWDNPVILVRLIEERFKALSTSTLTTKTQGVRVTAVYSPYPMNLRAWIWSRMESGDLFLGFEDLGMSGEGEDDSPYAKNMGDLCYYIPLREGNIMSILQNTAICQEEKFYVDSPDWFFDLQGLGEGDYQWFLEEVRQSDIYPHIYVGLGNVAIPSLSFFRMFDEVVLLDQPRDLKIHAFLERIATVSVEEGYVKADHIKLMDVRKQRS